MPTRSYRLEKGAAGFRYLNQPSASAEPCYALADVDDGEGLRSTLDAMAIVGISEAEREAVLRTVAAVLHLGNITFVSAPDEGSALSGTAAKEALAAVADLLQVVKYIMTVDSQHGLLLSTRPLCRHAPRPCHVSCACSNVLCWSTAKAAEVSPGLQECAMWKLFR